MKKDIYITAAPGTMEMLTELLHIDRADAEQCIAKIAAAVTDKPSETEADDAVYKSWPT